MRLRSLALHHFGRHDGMIFPSLQNGMTVVYGPNEAGKSTLLGGLRGILFAKALTGEGSLEIDTGARGIAELETIDGHRVTVDRPLKGKGKPKITLDEGQTQQGEAILREWIPELNQVEDIIYNSIFSFQLAELSGLAQMQQGLHQRIYTVGLLGRHSPFEVEAELQRRARDIFHSDGRARNTRLRSLNDELQALKNERTRQADSPEQYVSVEQSLHAANQRHTEIQEDLRALQSQERELSKQLDVLPVHERINLLSFELTSFDHMVRVPADTDNNVNRLTDSLDALGHRVQEAELAITELRQRRSQVTVDRQQVALLEKINELYIDISGYDELLKQASEKEQEIASVDDKWNRLLRELSSEWQEGHIDSVDLGIGRLQQATLFAEDLSSRNNDLRVLEKRLEDFREDEERKRQALEPLAWQLSAMPECLHEEVQRRKEIGANVEADAILLEAIRNDAQSLRDVTEQRIAAQRVESELGKDRQRSGGAVRLWFWSGPILTIVVGMILFFTGAKWGGVIVTAVGVLLAVGNIYAGGRNKESVSEVLIKAMQDTERLKEKEEGLERSLHDSLAALRTVSVTRAETAQIQHALADVQRLRRENAECEQAVRNDLRLFQEWHESHQRLNRLTQEQRNKQIEQQQAQKDWQSYLHELGFSETRMLPASFLKEADTILEIRENRELAQRKSAEVRQALARVSAHIAVICEVVDAFFGEGFGREIAVAANTLDRRDGLQRCWIEARNKLDRAREQAVEQQRQAHIAMGLDKELNHWDSELTKLKSQFDRGTEERHSVFVQFGVRSLESFQQLVKSNRDAAKLEADRDALLIQAHAKCGSRESYEQRASTLDATTKEQIHEELTRIRSELAALAEEGDRVNKEIWEHEERLRHWQDGQSAMDIDWKIAALEDDRRMLIHEWGALKLAEALTREARVRFERERQPRTLQIMGQVFASVTQGKYQSVRARIMHDGQAPELVCIDQTGREWSATRLSRGTQEQLYLALRIALIRDYSERGIQMPIMLDDPMVNFDAERLKSFFSILVKESRQEQMIYLTCHRQVVALAASYPEVSIIEL